VERKKEINKKNGGGGGVVSHMINCMLVYISGSGCIVRVVNPNLGRHTGRVASDMIDCI